MILFYLFVLKFPNVFAKGSINYLGFMSEIAFVVAISSLEGVSCETNVGLLLIIVFPCDSGLVYYSAC